MRERLGRIGSAIASLLPGRGEPTEHRRAAQIGIGTLVLLAIGLPLALLFRGDIDLPELDLGELGDPEDLPDPSALHLMGDLGTREESPTRPRTDEIEQRRRDYQLRHGPWNVL